MQNEHEDLLRILRDPLFWKPLVILEPAEMAAIVDQVDAEDERARAVCEILLAAPAAKWPERFRGTPEARTPGMVRQLLERMPLLLERRPADALQATSIAVAIAETLDPQPDWPDRIVMLRGQALRDHAYVLSFLGRYAEALRYVETAERTFAQIPATSFDLARLMVVKASALRMQNRADEAIALTRAAAAMFLEIGERRRYVNARITEAAMLYAAGAIREALDAWASVKGDSGLDAVGELRVTHNIAACLCDLGRHAEAVDSLERCVAEFSGLGLLTEGTRSRWYLGNALLGTGRPREAILLLRAAWQEFTELRVVVDAALAALDLAEALVASDEPAEVPAICHDVIAQLTDAGLPLAAIRAVSLLREAAALGNASRDLIRSTHATVRTVAERPSLEA